MMFKLIESVQKRWRKIRGAHLLAPLRAGAVSRNRMLVETPSEDEVAA